MWTIIISLAGMASFLYIFWKKLKEDYLPDQIFTIAFYVFLGIGVGFLISLKILSNWWFWTIGIFSIAGLVAGMLRFKFRFYETFEAFVIGIMPWLSLVFFLDSVVSASLTSFLGFSLIIVLIGLYYFLDTHYKNFSWYASGRIGFSGLAIGGIFMLIRAALALFSFPVLSLNGRLDSVLSAVVGFVLFFLIYNLAEK